MAGTQMCGQTKFATNVERADLFVLHSHVLPDDVELLGSHRMGRNV